MDAAWLLDGGTWQLFFAGNNGREPLFIYAQAMLIWLFGATPLTARLLGPLVGTLTVPLLYVLAKQLTVKSWPTGSKSADQRQFMPYVATAGLAVSLWHIILSRSGFRGVLLPTATILVFYAFWRARREASLKWTIWAGIWLGLSQYTYLAARLLPLPIVAFLILDLTGFKNLLGLNNISMFLNPVKVKNNSYFSLLIATLIFAPLGWVFYQNPSLFSDRTGDVLFKPHTLGELLNQIGAVVRLFFDGGMENWRHHLPGRPMLGWFGWLGFWPGIFLCLRYYRYGAPLFLLIAFVILLAPAPLSVPPIHALRLSSMLPIYYIIFAIGLLKIGQAISKRATVLATAQWLKPSFFCIAFLTVIMLTEAGLTSFDYFHRWTYRQETYIEFNSPLVDLVEDLIQQTKKQPVLIPLHLYVHPTTRYLLHDQFTESSANTLEIPAGQVQLVTLPDKFQAMNVANIPDIPAFVWLSRDSTGQGTAYVSRPWRANEQTYLERLKKEVKPDLYRDRFGRDIAHYYTLESAEPLRQMFTDTMPQRTITLQWRDLAQLVGYEILPELARPAQPLTVNLYWHSLTDLPFDYRLFLQLIDRDGAPITQWEGTAFMEDMYRWRPNGILPTQHKLWLGPNTPDGAYLLRLGFFKPHSDQRLPLTWQATPLAADQAQLGLFYVSANGRDPRQPTTPLTTTFGSQIELLGLTMPNKPLATKTLTVTLHWQTVQPTDKPYTVFLQLLNSAGQVVSGWDSQPFNGLYPTNFWSTGEVVVDTFKLPLPDGLPPDTYRLITGFYDLPTGQRLSVDMGGDSVELAKIKK